MQSFSQYNLQLEQARSLHNLTELALFIEQGPDILLEENIEEAFDVGAALEKAGFHVKKGRGLIQILASAGKNIGQILYYAVKVAAGDIESKPKLKKLLSKKIRKEDVIDVLLKLDQLTLHALTGPIHAIDALTGWHIGPNLHKIANLKVDVSKKVDDAIKILKDVSQEVGDKTKKRLERALSVINGLFNPSPEKALTT